MIEAEGDDGNVVGHYQSEAFNGAASVIEAEGNLEQSAGAEVLAFNGAASVIEAEGSTHIATAPSPSHPFNGAASVIEAEAPCAVLIVDLEHPSTGPPR